MKNYFVDCSTQFIRENVNKINFISTALPTLTHGIHNSIHFIIYVFIVKRIFMRFILILYNINLRIL